MKKIWENRTSRMILVFLMAVLLLGLVIFLALKFTQDNEGGVTEKKVGTIAKGSDYPGEIFTDSTGDVLIRFPKSKEADFIPEKNDFLGIYSEPDDENIETTVYRISLTRKLEDIVLEESTLSTEPSDETENAESQSFEANDFAGRVELIFGEKLPVSTQVVFNSAYAGCTYRLNIEIGADGVLNVKDYSDEKYSVAKEDVEGYAEFIEAFPNVSFPEGTTLLEPYNYAFFIGNDEGDLTKLESDYYSTSIGNDENSRTEVSMSGFRILYDKKEACICFADAAIFDLITSVLKQTEGAEEKSIGGNTVWMFEEGSMNGAFYQKGDYSVIFFTKAGEENNLEEQLKAFVE